MPRKRKKSVQDSMDAETLLKYNTHKSSIEDKLIQNIIELQKVNISMIEKFDKLSNQISDLLSLFEMTAKSFADNPINQVSEKDKEFLEKVEELSKKIL